MRAGTWVSFSISSGVAVMSLPSSSAISFSRLAFCCSKERNFSMTPESLTLSASAAASPAHYERGRRERGA